MANETDKKNEKDPRDVEIATLKAELVTAGKTLKAKNDELDNALFEIDSLKSQLKDKSDELVDLARSVLNGAARAGPGVAEPAFAQRDASPAAKKPLPEEFKGTRTYKLNAPHYRQGQRYEVGETITVTDEIPSKTWELLDEADAPKPKASKQAQKSGRPSDADL